MSTSSTKVPILHTDAGNSGNQGKFIMASLVRHLFYVNAQQDQVTEN